MPNGMLIGKYREAGGIYEVEVLSDETNEKGWRKVKLRCLSVLSPPVRFAPIPVGDEWLAEAAKDAGAYAGWFLTDVRELVKARTDA